MSRWLYTTARQNNGIKGPALTFLKPPNSKLTLLEASDDIGTRSESETIESNKQFRDSGLPDQSSLTHAVDISELPIVIGQRLTATQGERELQFS